MVQALGTLQKFTENAYMPQHKLTILRLKKPEKACKQSNIQEFFDN